MKKNVKIVLLILNILVLALCGCSSDNTSLDDATVSDSSNQEYDKEEKKYKELEVVYKVLENGNAVVAGYSGDGNRATINQDYEGHKVVRIVDSAFEGCNTLETVLFWAEIEEIGMSAFKDCTALEEISIPFETTDIGDYAFAGCTKLEELILWGAPNIGAYSFANCTSLKEVNISYDTKYVGEHAFDGCSELSQVTVWNEETEFGTNAFMNCAKLDDKPIEDSEEEKNDDVEQPDNEDQTVTNDEQSTTENDTAEENETKEENTSIEVPYNIVTDYDVSTLTEYAHIDSDVVRLGNKEKLTVTLTAYPEELTIDDFIIDYDDSYLDVSYEAIENSEINNKTVIEFYVTAQKEGTTDLVICSVYDIYVYGEDAECIVITIKGLSLQDGKVVYVTSSGEKYHSSEACAGEGATKTTLSDAQAYKYSACKKCN